jgi:hypothetical protein
MIYPHPIKKDGQTNFSRSEIYRLRDRAAQNQRKTSLDARQSIDAENSLTLTLA